MAGRHARIELIAGERAAPARSASSPLSELRNAVRNFE